MSTYRAQQGPRPITAHHPLMAALIGLSIGAGFLVVGAPSVAALDAQPFCSEYDVPDTVAPVEVAPAEVTAPTTAPVVVPVAVVPAATVPDVTVPTPTTTQAPVPAPAVATPAEAPAPTTTVAPQTSVLGEVVVNDQSPAVTLPVTGLPTGQLLMAAAALLIVGEAMRKMAARRRNEAMAAELAARAE